MRFLVDTVVWLWSVGEVGRLNQKARDVLADPKHELYFSAASVWEIAIKTSIGRMDLKGPPNIVVPRETQRQGLLPLQVTYTHASAVCDLPRLHGDPFDRLLVAQARCEGLSLITSDRTLGKYPVEILWAGQ
ncbi:MAG TPA: type II toxin-antitoxin system VapC family toxin [Terriglobales bacterium]|nr:type II toxin-antitoxin system VapC family toxin [Terriglobales bacterium]